MRLITEKVGPFELNCVLFVYLKHIVALCVCFCMFVYVYTLVHKTKCIAIHLFQEQPGSLSQVDLSKSGGRLYMIPKELWRLVEHINVHGKAVVRNLVCWMGL